MAFAEVMRLALYDPEHGYYGGTPRRIGRQGDFYTAVSVGPLYGRLLAAVALETWEALGQPAEFTIIEQAAHDGQLMADVWAGLQGTAVEALVQFRIIEPQAGYREVQEKRLRPLLGNRVDWLPEVASLPATCGFYLCNELLDAFPVHRVQWTGQEWLELGVVVGANGQLGFEPRPLSTAELAAEVALFPRDLPVGYVTEAHPAASAWMRSLGSSAFFGRILIADYGYEAADYLSPDRVQGTLRRYSQHKVDDKVLEELGQCDLTAHVNFGRLMDVAEETGFSSVKFMEQGRFLTHAAKPWLASLEGRPPNAEALALLRQFQSLTHPGHMGAAFRMLLLERRQP